MKKKKAKPSKKKAENITLKQAKERAKKQRYMPTAFGIGVG